MLLNEVHKKIIYGVFGWHDLGIWIWIWMIKIQIYCLDSLEKVKDWIWQILQGFKTFKTLEFEIKAFQI